ncbi:MAG: Ni/Fe hydrogenase subunit alpha [Desulfovibrio sp.]|nr:Ni/Fe hydrogenase subunit alpha [Desulfovibrio sp.]
MAKAVKEKTVGTAKRIDVHYLTRVEGHGNIIAEVDDAGKVTACRWEIPEAPRFFEAMMLGRGYADVHHIASRICGICSIGHQLASLQATEEALGVVVSEQTLALRKLALHGENIQSHLLHVGYLVLPDLLGADSVIPLASTHRQELLHLVKARAMSNEFCRIVSGRTTHPQRLMVGGMTRLPTEEDLVRLRRILVEAMPEMMAVVDVFAAVKGNFPDFTRKTEYIGLTSPSEYGLYWGEVASSMAPRRPAALYQDVAKEYCVPTSTAKWSRGVDGPYMVGALARFNINHAQLGPAGRDAAEKLGLKAPCHNPYYISLAQVVEVVHSIEDSIKLTDQLLSRGLRPEAPAPVRVVPGRGVAAVEVPRGLLFHAYEYDENGRMVHADCVIPTNQNHANIQKDLEALTPLIAREDKASIELKLSMLVRAYDPCISCSAHNLDLSPEERSLVRFVPAGSIPGKDGK